MTAWTETVEVACNNWITSGTVKSYYKSCNRQDFREDVKALGFSLGAHLCAVIGTSAECQREEGAPRGPAGTPHLMAPEGLRGAGVATGCSASPAALSVELHFLHTTFLGVPSWSPALSLPSPKSKDSLGTPGPLVRLAGVSKGFMLA